MMKKKVIAALAASLTGASVLASGGAASAQEVMIGEIRTFGFNFCPRGWANTNGQLLPIAQNQALYSLVGTYYGGDGRTTFGLPDLRGRVVIAPGQAPGLSNYAIGQKGGAETVTLNTAQIPSHNHTVNGTAPGNTVNVRPANQNGSPVLGSATGSSQSTGNAGGGQAHENRPPYLAMTTCIALQGLYPSRN